MNTDIKAPGSESDSSDSPVEIGVNKTIAPKVAEATEAPQETEPADLTKEPAPVEGKLENAQVEQPETKTMEEANDIENAVQPSPVPEQENKPVPPANVIKLADQGTPLAQQVAQETEEQRRAREEEKNKLAKEGALNPTMPSTDGIKGQSMAGMVQEMNADDNQNTMAGQPQAPTTETPQPGTNNNQAQEQPKKKSWWKFW